MLYISCTHYEHLQKFWYNLKYLNRHTLIKRITKCQYELIKDFKGKKIDKVITPNEFYQITYHIGELDSLAYAQEKVEGFINLENFDSIESHFSDKEILIFFRNLFQTEYNMHEEDVTSRDIHNGNILINSELDYRIIDLDWNGSPSCLEHFRHITIQSNYNTLERYKLSDKVSLLYHILYGMRDGNFSHGRSVSSPTFIKKFHLPKEIEEKWSKWTGNDASILDKEDYFIEDFNQLIEENYKLPYRR